MSSFYKAHFALLFVNMIYGANYVIAKGVMPGYVAPSGFILLRALGATLVFWIIKTRIREKIKTKDLVRLAFCGLFGVALNQLFFFNGLNLTSPVNSSIIMTLNPILVLVLSSVFIKERVTKTKVIGIFLGMTGSVILSYMSMGNVSGTSSLTGDLFVLINAVSYGIYLVLVKPLMSRYKPITVISWVFLFGLIFITPIGFQQLTEIDWVNMPFQIYMRLTYVIVGVTVFTYLLNIYALKTVTATVTSSYIYLQPVLAAVAVLTFSYYGLEDYSGELTIWKGFSAILIFVGVYLVSSRK